MPVTQTIQMVINTLNTIEVRGESNLGSLLGSIQALNGVLRTLSKEAEVKTDGNEANQ